MEREMEYRDKILERFKKHMYNRMDYKIYYPLREEIDILKKQVDELISKEPEPDLFFPIWHMELSVRAINCMQNAKIKTVGELVKKSKSDLLRINNLGRNTMNEISKELFLQFGLRLKGEEEKSDV